jgi:translocation and assembly module TamB
LIYQLTVPRLAVLSALAGVELAGSGTAHGRVTGKPSSPTLQARFAARDLAVARIALIRLDGTATARNLLSRPEGELNLAVAPRGQPLSLATRFSLGASGGLSLNAIEFTAPRTRLAGEMAISPAGMLDGAINGDVGDLRWAGSLIGLPVSGDAKLEISLKSGSAGQELNARVDARDFAVGAGDDLPMEAGQAALKLHVADAFRRPRGSGEITVAGSTLAGLTVTTASLTAEGDAGTLRVSLEGEGERPQAFAVQANGEMAILAGAQRLRLDVFEGNFGPLQAKLNGPATFTRARDGLEISGLDAGIGEGRLSGGGRIGERGSDLAFALAGLPMDLLTAFAPSLDIAGVVSGDLRFAGTAAQPAVNAELRFADLREAGTEASDAVGVDARIGVDLGGGRFLLTSEFGGRSDIDLSARLDAPVRFSLRPFSLELADDSPLTGAARGNLDLALLPRVFDLRGDALSGRLTTDIAVAGTLSAPVLNGEARIAGGGYESAENGTVLREVTALLVGANDRIELRSFSATDGGEGRLSVSASAIIAPTRRTNYSGELTLQRFTLLRRRNCTAVASGRLKLDETEEGPQISGEITANSAEIRIPERLPNRIVSIDVVEVNVPASRTRSASAKANARAGSIDDFPLSLDVTGIIPGNAFLRGRGIESEWRGELRVRGTLGKPDIAGKLKVVRGNVNLLGRLFRLEKGTVTFTGGESIDPDLDIVATGQAADVTASIRIAGRASQPTVDVSSDSGLPQEEVISRILFGKGTGGLSPVQAALLADSAPSLLGMSDTSLLGQMRSGTGLDVLTVESKDGSAASSTVVGGKYIDDDVFVRVEQGLTPESRNVGVEVRVLPKVILEGDVGGQGDGRIGVRFRHDY